jgi:hypothetical protein
MDRQKWRAQREVALAQRRSNVAAVSDHRGTGEGSPSADPG